MSKTEPSFRETKLGVLPIEMINLDEDIKIRIKNLKTLEDKKEFIAYVMWRILWIHPFFDYNGRITRLFGELFLLKNNMKLTTFEGTNRKDFVNAMKKATNENIFDDIVKLLD